MPLASCRGDACVALCPNPGEASLAPTKGVHDLSSPWRTDRRPPALADVIHHGRAKRTIATTPPGRNKGAARSAHEMVARGALRDVHPLGHLFRPRRHIQGQEDRRHRRMDYE